MKMIRPWNKKDGWYEISPADAQALLERRARNRPLREHKAQVLASDIRARRWRDNGESLIFDDRDRLLDGQHRLRGCVLANAPVVAYCVFGVSPEHFASLDRGTPRGGADTAALMGFDNYNFVAAVARLAILYANGGIASMSKAATSMEDLKLYLKRHRGQLCAAAEFINKHRGGFMKLVSPSHVGFVYYMAATSERNKAQEFVEKLSTGAGLHRGDAPLVFRNRVMEKKGVRSPHLQTEKLALLIKAWNAFVEGRKVGLLRWVPGVEPFPQFNGLNANE